MTPIEVCLVFSILFVKHFLVDFPLQTSYQYLNKGKYGHPGGILHSGLHGLSSLMLLPLVVSFNSTLVWLCIGEALIHYHIDWLKVTVNTAFQLKPDKHDAFWWLLGIDQLLHYMTYVWMVLVLI